MREWSLCFRDEVIGTESLSNLPEVTQVVGGRFRVLRQCCLQVGTEWSSMGDKIENSVYASQCYGLIENWDICPKVQRVKDTEDNRGIQTKADGGQQRKQLLLVGSWGRLPGEGGTLAMLSSRKEFQHMETVEQGEWWSDVIGVWCKPWDSKVKPWVRGQESCEI